MQIECARSSSARLSVFENPLDSEAWGEIIVSENLHPGSTFKSWTKEMVNVEFYKLSHQLSILHLYKHPCSLEGADAN